MSHSLLFVGDPAQLPPVGENASPALSDAYLSEQFQLKVDSFDLKKVMRQAQDSAILDRATELRDAMLAERFNKFSLQPNGQDIEQVDADLEKLRRKISRSSYGDDLLLLVWALEQGERKGYHCHVALVFDERKRIGAWSIAKAIGKFWESITDGDGSYFNCHDRRYLTQYEKP